MLGERAASPVQLAQKLDATLGTIAYHVRTLHNLGLIELVATRQRRGATEHVYQAIETPRFSDDAWEGLGPVAKQRLLTAMLRQIGEYVNGSAAVGGFDRSDANVSRAVAQARRARLEAARARDRRSGWPRSTASRSRPPSAIPTGEAEHEPFEVGLVLLLFEAMAFSDQPAPEPRAGRRRRRWPTHAAARAGRRRAALDSVPAMRLALMIEGQEGVDVGRLAGARRHRRAARLRRALPLRPLPVGRRRARAQRARRVGDAVRAGGDHVDDPARDARLAGDLPPPVRARQARRDRRPHLRRPGRARASAPAGGRPSTGLRLPVPADGRADGPAGRATGDHPRLVGRGPFTFSRRALERVEDLDAQPKPVQEPELPLDHGRRGRAAQRGARRAPGARVQRRPRRPGRRRRASRDQPRRGLRGGRPRPRDAAACRS